MFGADATIVWVDDEKGPQAEDYYLSAYLQVRRLKGSVEEHVVISEGNTMYMYMIRINNTLNRAPISVSTFSTLPPPPPCLSIHSSVVYIHVHVHVHDGTYRVILRIVKAGCHPVAIAQVVEH